VGSAAAARGNGTRYLSASKCAHKKRLQTRRTSSVFTEFELVNPEASGKRANTSAIGSDIVVAAGIRRPARDVE
jgi:hypothetical protein